MYNQSALPFDPINLDPAPSNQGTFNMTSPMPHNFNPNMRELFPNIDGQNKAIVDDKADLNPLRGFLYNQLSSNGFNNPAYSQLLCMVADCAELYFATRKFGTDPGTVIWNAAENLVGIAASANLFEFPELANFIEPSLGTGAERNMAIFNSLKGEIAQFQQSRGAPPQHQQNSQYSTSSYQPTRQPQGQHFQGGGQGYGQPQQPVRQVQRAGGPNPNGVSSNNGMFKANSGHAPNNNVGVRTRGGVHEYDDDEEIFEAPTRVVRGAPVEVEDTPAETPAPLQQRNKLTGPVIMDEVPEGFTVKPGTLTNLLYNKQMQRKLYIVTPTNRYVEVIVALGDDMDYNEHELDAAQVSQTLPPHKAKVAKDEEGDVNTVWNNYQFDGETLAINPNMQGGSTSIQVHSTIDAHSKEEAELILRQSLQRQGVKVNDGTILEYHYRHLKPISFAKGYDGEQVLLRCETLEEFLYELPRANMPARIIGLLSTRAIAIINEVLNHSLSIPWTISELSDYDELIVSLAEEKGKVAHDLFVAKSGELVPLMFNALPAPEAAEYLSKCYPLDLVEGHVLEIRDGVNADSYAIERVDGEEGDDFKPVEEFDDVFEVMVTYDTVSVTLLPWTLDDMGMAASQTEGVITESANPVEFNTLKELFNRTKESNVRHYYIDTEDGKRLSVHRGWLNKNYYKVVTVK